MLSEAEAVRVEEVLKRLLEEHQDLLEKVVRKVLEEREEWAEDLWELEEWRREWEKSSQHLVSAAGGI